MEAISSLKTRWTMSYAMGLVREYTCIVRLEGLKLWDVAGLQQAGGEQVAGGGCEARGCEGEESGISWDSESGKGSETRSCKDSKSGQDSEIGKDIERCKEIERGKARESGKKSWGG